jgi:hypothetical protein
MDAAEQNFLIVQTQIAESNHNLATMFCGAHMSGTPDVMGGMRSDLDIDLLGSEENLLRIKDKELGRLMRALRSHMQEFSELDAQIIAIFAEVVGLPSPDTKEERKKLRQKINYYENRPDHATTPLDGILLRPDYKVVLERSKATYYAVEELKEQIDARVAELLKSAENSS